MDARPFWLVGRLKSFMNVSNANETSNKTKLMHAHNLATTQSIGTAITSAVTDAISDGKSSKAAFVMECHASQFRHYCGQAGSAMKLQPLPMPSTQDVLNYLRINSFKTKLKNDAREK